MIASLGGDVKPLVLSPYTSFVSLLVGVVKERTLKASVRKKE